MTDIGTECPRHRSAQNFQRVREGIVKASGLIIIAGNETFATLLSGAFFYVLPNPDWYREVQKEIIDTFQDEPGMTFSSRSQLNVFNAVILESCQKYPPVPATLPRLTSQAGVVVCGRYIPPTRALKSRGGLRINPRRRFSFYFHTIVVL